jgi:hypothetical protein
LKGAHDLAGLAMLKNQGKDMSQMQAWPFDAVAYFDVHAQFPD